MNEVPNYCIIICSACDENTAARNSLLSSPPILFVDARDQSCDAKSKHVMQMQPRPPIRNQLMHLLHHNIATHRFIFTPPFKFDWCQGMAHCTHETCQARTIQPTPTSPTSTSLHGSSCHCEMIGKNLCVEDLKLFKPHHTEALFGDEYSE